MEDRCWECDDSKGVHTSVLEKAGAASKPLEPLLAAATCVPAEACLVAMKSPLVPRIHLMAALPGQGPAAAPDWGRNSPAAAPFCVTQKQALFPLVFTPSSFSTCFHSINVSWKDGGGQCPGLFRNGKG